MSVEDRRTMIVHAVLPLLVEHGATVTTSQIARAAGIGEGTIFRAFKDKDELFDACTAEALRPDHVLDSIADIPVDQPLEDRLVEAAEALGAHLERMGALMGALHATGRVRQRDPEQRLKERNGLKNGLKGGLKGGRSQSMAAMRDAMTELFEPDKDRLRLPADQLASLFITLLFGGRRMPADETAPTTRQVVDVFLHGAVEAA
jgi:AcrR family transcriptional regulator